MSAVTLTEAEREALGDWWDQETTVSVAGVFPVVARIIAARVQQAEAEAFESYGYGYDDGLAAALDGTP